METLAARSGSWFKERLLALQLGALALALLAGLWSGAWSVTSALDAQLHDSITRKLPAPAAAEVPAAAQDVLLIDIDEPSLAQIGPWPWPRTVLADMVRRLREKGARAQAWDLYLPETAPGDDALNAALTPAPGRQADVVIGQVLIVDPQVQAPPHLGKLRDSADIPDLCASPLPVVGHFGVAETLAAARAGHLSATPDADGGLRRLPAVLCQGALRMPQLALVTAEILHPGKPWTLSAGTPFLGPAQWLERGPMRFALDAQSRIVVPYSRPHHAWPAVSALHLLDGSVDAERIKGKVVIVGATALGLVDTASTPFHPNAPGVSVHAEVMAAALGGRWSVMPGTGWPVVLVLSMALGLFMVGVQRGAYSRTVTVGSMAALLLAPLALAVAARAFGPVGHILPVTPVVLSQVLLLALLVALQMEQQLRRTRQLSHHLESFLPVHLAREIARQDPSGDSLGRSASGVIMAVHVTGLQRWSAAVGSFRALALVHAITSLAETHARRQGGTLEHVQGDTLLLSWPTRQPEHHAATEHEAVQSAVQAGRSLLAELGDLLATNETEAAPLGLRIALDQGDFLLAVAGSRTSRRSLMLGTAVNSVLAMLPLCEELASPILMGQRAANTGPRLSLHPMGQFLLPESRSPQTIYRVEP